MKRPFRHSWVAILVALSPLACGLITAPNDLSAGCGAENKACDGACVSVDDPRYGCSPETCAPCALPHAVARCTPGPHACTVASCVGTWDDCDDRTDNGCETDLTADVMHCGRCDQPCPVPYAAEPACGAVGCYIRRCTTDRGDCDGEFSNGCEINLKTSREHCGSCGVACEGLCVNGECND